MFDYRNIVDDDTLTMEFIKEGDSYIVKDKKTGNQVGTLVTASESNTFLGSSEDVSSQYKMWLTRPERKVGVLADLEDRSIDELMSEYEERLIGAHILHQKSTVFHDDKNPAGYERMIDWLRSTDFYRAPASTQFHESFVGGLLLHSLKVYNAALALTKVDSFKDISLTSLTLCTLTHDWCKIGFYESYKRNVKDEISGTWNSVDAFRVNQQGIPLGHGVTSMFIASRFFSLSVDEALAIRWHQGRWNVCDAEQNEFQKANATYPLVYLIQFADQLACCEYN